MVFFLIHKNGVLSNKYRVVLRLAQVINNANRLPWRKQLLTGFPVESPQFVFQVARLIDPPSQLLGGHLGGRLGEVTKSQFIKGPYAGVISRFFHTFQLFVNSYKVGKKDEKSKYTDVDI